MNKDTFLTSLKNLLQIQEEISEQTYLFDLDEWDSLAMMSVVAFFDKELGKKITVSELQKLDTVQQLIDLALY